ncbi:MAG: hypothetical protein CFE21_05415 [Bacteroidetes bacterium B1(2017)]|nr:MAG: hypothetical protein CFE21_05415 [Bacteroidetes bacterium B1(2017)]
MVTFAQSQKDGLGEGQRREFDKHFFAGTKDKMIKAYEDAEIEFKGAIAIDGSNAAAHFQLASVLLPQKKESEALVEAERAFKLEPTNEWYAKLIIELYKNAKQYDLAAKTCEQAYKHNKDVHFLYELSGMYVLIGKWPKAIKVLDEIEKTQGVTEQLSRQKEEIYLSKNNLKGAIKEIEKLSATYPDQLQYKGLLADLYMRNGKEKEGLAIYQNIQKIDPFNGFAAFSLADYYFSKGDTLGFFNQLEIGMKSRVEPRIKLQVLAKLIPSSDFGSGHLAKCKKLIFVFSETNPDASEPYLLLGDLALQDRNFEEARNQYSISTSKGVSSILPWEQLLFCDQQLQRYDYMKLDCERLMIVFPNYASAYLFHSIACRQLKEYELAFFSAQKGVEFADDEATSIQLLSNLGDMAHYAKRYSVSDSAFEAVLALDPINSLALNNYAYFLSLRNADLDKAENMSKRSNELDPNNPSNLDTYGWILFQKKNYSEAKIQIEKSLSISPNNAEVLEHLGDIEFKLNNVDKAVEIWNKSLRISGNSNSELEKKIKQRSILLP